MNEIKQMNSDDEKAMIETNIHMLCFSIQADQE